EQLRVVAPGGAVRAGETQIHAQTLKLLHDLPGHDLRAHAHARAAADAVFPGTIGSEVALLARQLEQHAEPEVRLDLPAAPRDRAVQLEPRRAPAHARLARGAGEAALQRLDAPGRDLDRKLPARAVAVHVRRVRAAHLARVRSARGAAHAAGVHRLRDRKAP